METFNFDTIKDFDNHIAKSIPNYDVLNETIMSISEYFLTPNSNIYDLGCSTGRLLKSLPYSLSNKKIGYDNSLIMPDKDDVIIFKKTDLNEEFEIINACIVYSVFTMQFLNKTSREKFCKTIYDGLNYGGAFILCEKIYQEDGFMQEILTFSHYDYKRKYFNDDEIFAKERDLRFIMKPNKLSSNLFLLKSVGFNTITQFWQSYNFVGLIAIK